MLKFWIILLLCGLLAWVWACGHNDIPGGKRCIPVDINDRRDAGDLCPGCCVVQYGFACTTLSKGPHPGNG